MPLRLLPLHDLTRLPPQRLTPPPHASPRRRPSRPDLSLTPPRMAHPPNALRPQPHPTTAPTLSASTSPCERPQRTSPQRPHTSRTIRQTRTMPILAPRLLPSSPIHPSRRAPAPPQPRHATSRLSPPRLAHAAAHPPAATPCQHRRPQPQHTLHPLSPPEPSPSTSLAQFPCKSPRQRFWLPSLLLAAHHHVNALRPLRLRPLPHRSVLPPSPPFAPRPLLPRLPPTRLQCFLQLLRLRQRPRTSHACRFHRERDIGDRQQRRSSRLNERIYGPTRPRCSERLILAVGSAVYVPSHQTVVVRRAGLQLLEVHRHALSANPLAKPNRDRQSSPSLRGAHPVFEVVARLPTLRVDRTRQRRRVLADIARATGADERRGLAWGRERMALTDALHPEPVLRDEAVVVSLPARPSRWTKRGFWPKRGMRSVWCTPRQTRQSSPSFESKASIARARSYAPIAPAFPLALQYLEHIRTDLLGRGNHVPTSRIRTAAHSEHQRKRHNDIGVAETSTHRTVSNRPLRPHPLLDLPRLSPRRLPPILSDQPQPIRSGSEADGHYAQ